MNILGISCFYHDSAACLVQDGRIMAAAQEERFSRKKHDPRFPKNAIIYCLNEAKITIDKIDYVVFYDKPFLTFERLLMSYLTVAPKGLRSWLKAMPLWLGKKLYIPKVINRETGYEGDVLYTEHHEAHAASAFYPSPFQEAAFLTIDGVGEWATASYGFGKDKDLTLLKELHFPDSLFSLQFNQNNMRRCEKTHGRTPDTCASAHVEQASSTQIMKPTLILIE